MPKLTKEQLKNVKYVSMAHYSRAIDQIEDFDDKLKFTTRYLLSHGMDGQATDYSLEEAIHLARLKLADVSKTLRDKVYNDEEVDPADLYIDYNEFAVNPYVEDEKDDIENQFFMGNPAEYLKHQAEKVAKEIDGQDISVGQNVVSLRENCDRLIRQLDANKTKEILIAEAKGMTTLNIQARMEAKYRDRATFQKIQKETKPGFIARMLGTRSNAGKNFDEVYAAFNNPNHALYGNLDAMEKATVEYLGYKDANKGKLEKIRDIKEPKEAFAANLLDAIREQKQNDEIFKGLVGHAYDRKLTAERVEDIKGPEPEEVKHREPLELDIDDEDELDNSMDESQSEKDLDNSMDESQSEIDDERSLE